MMRTRGAPPSNETSIAMNYTLATIGARIRQFRTQKGLTLQALGRVTGLSPSMLSLVERGKTSPSIGTLIVVCSALEVHMSDLVAVEERTPRDPVSHRAEQPVFQTAAGVLRRVLRADNARGVEIAINEYAPDTGSAAAPVHHAGHEYGVVLEGRLTVEVDGIRHVLDPGDLISYESSRDHRIWNYGADHAKALWVNLERA
ncbi:MAG TPA: cupin domain-containing protein [Geminicoccaceae bacterium]|nr:cupin domain-containing protein [Geminicoccaceae bacterium]